LAKSRKQHPAVKGLTWHRTQFYSFFLPMNWHRFLSDSGEVLGPDPDDHFTLFAVHFIDLGTPITPDDLDILAEGFFESLKQLDACHIESRDQKATASKIELEAKYTFQEQGTTRKCWKRVYYHETRQTVMTAQGATPEKYDYWLPWFFEAMMTAKVHSTKPETPF
jgi:hypothetical protein